MVAVSRPPDFVGLGAQKAATSWLYFCLYEHPGVCAPVKELHFFSRDDAFAKGYQWYERVFAGCPAGAVAGEFSTSYLSSEEAPARIAARYPDVRLVASLRNPVDRALSNHANDLLVGAVPTAVPFREVLADHPEYVDGGRYATHLRRYFERFGSDAVHVILYDDIVDDPSSVVRSLYDFLGIAPDYVPRVLDERVNPARAPRSVGVERALNRVSGALRRGGLHRLAWWGRRAGLGRAVRRLNAGATPATAAASSEDRRLLYEELEPEIDALAELLGRDLAGWRA